MPRLACQTYQDAPMKAKDQTKRSGQAEGNKLSAQIGELLAELESCHLLLDSTYDWETFHDSAGRMLYCSPSCEQFDFRGAKECLASVRDSLGL
jgi:hypothetical protein